VDCVLPALVMSCHCLWSVVVLARIILQRCLHGVHVSRGGHSFQPLQECLYHNIVPSSCSCAAHCHLLCIWSSLLHRWCLDLTVASTVPLC
jgi:hypothetical protein